jgi:2-polyprenyl-3-methyl-5-hydroxy-6-metoxy-1,4-benzoquinol methylase
MSGGLMSAAFEVIVTLDRIGFAFLRMFCRPVGSPDYAMKGVHYQAADTISQTAVFPDFDSVVRGKDALDFGCGHGYQTIAFAEHGAKSATGVEIQSGLLASARARAAGAGVKATFLTHMEGSYDVIYSQNSFEHLLDPDEICSQMMAHLRPGGHIYITFGPPWPR